MSMNPIAPDVTAVAASHLLGLLDYPDPEPGEARLAEAIGVDSERLVLTNGGSEAIALVARLEPLGHVVEPEFSLYRRHLSDVDSSAPRWRSNPSNPMGRLADLDDSAVLGRRDDLAVWDEAFFPLATGRWTAPELSDHRVWRLGSLTKLWSCPGLRLGYAIAPDASAARCLRDLRPRWSVNGLALAVIPDLLAATDLRGWSSEITARRERFRRDLEAVGFTVVDTDVNWLLVDAGSGLREQLIPHGVLVRDCSSFGMPTISRVALPAERDVDRVVSAFDTVVGGRR